MCVRGTLSSLYTPSISDQEKVFIILTPGGSSGEVEDLRNWAVDELEKVVLIASCLNKIIKLFQMIIMSVSCTFL